MRIKLIPLLVITMKQIHCSFNQNLNVDNNDYLLLLLNILVWDGISQHLKRVLLYSSSDDYIYLLNISHALAVCWMRIKKLDSTSRNVVMTL